MTAREALEHINGVYAFEDLIRDRARKNAREEADEDEEDFPGFEGTPGAGQTFMGGAELLEDGQSVSRPAAKGKGRVTITGPRAQKVADVPHLTKKGSRDYWPEWNELELAETDPAKEPLKIRW